MRTPKKRCRFCHCRFQPDPRTRERQYACSAETCQRLRKSENQRIWLGRNPDYFEGRAEKLRAWRQAHPGYFANYRRQHPDAARKHREREQLRRRKRRALDSPVANQAEIAAHNPLLLGLIARLQPVAKPNHIDLSPEACDTDGLRIRATLLARRSTSHG